MQFIFKNIIHTTIDKYSLEEEILCSISKDYNGFQKCFNDISKEKRKCFSIEDEDNKLVAIIIYKIETISGVHPLYRLIGDINKVIKISTFKVEKIIKVALFENIYGLYLTAYPWHDYLIKLLQKFGFEEITEDKEEIFLYKELNKFIVPIRPHYHDSIFYDYPKREYTLFDNLTSINPKSNSILKAYFGKFSRDIKVGDIIFIHLQLSFLIIGVIPQTDIF
jgi:hypothetical protein